jgi:hypothetical protein
LFGSIAATGRTENVMNWVEIPAQRVLQVDRTELMNEFEIYDEAGNRCGCGRAYLLFRKKDGKRFKFAQFGDLNTVKELGHIFLQEI